MRLNNSDSKQTANTIAAVDSAMLRANRLTGASASARSILATIAQSRPGSCRGS